MSADDDGARDFPMSIRLSSDDLPDPATPSWYSEPPFELVVDSARFVEDDPERLRAQGPRVIGSALMRLAIEGAWSLRRDVREVAALLLEHLSDGLHHDSLDFDLGLRPRNGSPDLSLIAKRADRDKLLLALARLVPWSEMGPWSAAEAIKAAVSDYEARRWPTERPPERRYAPVGEPGATAWRALRLDLPQGPTPSVADLARMIRADREGQGN